MAAMTWEQTDYRLIPKGDSPAALLARDYGDKNVTGWGLTEIMDGAIHVWVRWDRNLGA